MSQGPVTGPESAPPLDPELPELLLLEPELPLELETPLDPESLEPPLEAEASLDPELFEPLLEPDRPLEEPLEPEPLLELERPELLFDPELLPDPEGDPLLASGALASGKELESSPLAPQAQKVAAAAVTAKAIPARMQTLPSLRRSPRPSQADWVTRWRHDGAHGSRFLSPRLPVISKTERIVD